MNSIEEQDIRPQTDEYANYYSTYVEKVEGDDIKHTISSQGEDISGLITAIPKEKEDYRYDEGKWSPKEMLGHLIDTERIMSYRALRFAREDLQELAGYEQDDYVVRGRFTKRTMQSLVSEYRAVRSSTISLLDSMDEEALKETGVANGCLFSVRALFFIIAGHEQHHISVLKDKYGIG